MKIIQKRNDNNIIESKTTYIIKIDNHQSQLKFKKKIVISRVDYGRCFSLSLSWVVGGADWRSCCVEGELRKGGGERDTVSTKRSYMVVSGGVWLAGDKWGGQCVWYCSGDAKLVLYGSGEMVVAGALLVEFVIVSRHCRGPTKVGREFGWMRRNGSHWKMEFLCNNDGDAFGVSCFMK